MSRRKFSKKLLAFAFAFTMALTGLLLPADVFGSDMLQAEGTASASTLEELTDAIKAGVTNIDLTATIEVTGAVSIQPEQATILTSSQDGAMFRINEGGKLTISGSLTMDGKKAERSKALILNSGTLNIKDSVTLTGGNTKTGGAIYCGDNGEIVMEGGVVSNNTAEYGAAIRLADHSKLDMAGGQIVNNQTIKGGDGGAIYGDVFSSVVIKGGTISNNKANDKNSIGGSGGAINASGKLQILGGEITKNSGFLGGGIYTSSAITAENTNISENKAANGGGLYISCAYGSKFKNVTISQNSATGDGGGLYNSSGSNSSAEDKYITDLNNCSVLENTANRYGGGIYNRVDYSLKTEGSKISGNTAQSNGGGIYNDGYLTVYHSEISKNFSKSYGGGGAGIYGAAGGKYAWDASRLIIRSANIMENVILPDYDAKGAGIYVAKGCDFRLGGKLDFAKDNDIYLEDRVKINTDVVEVDESSGVQITLKKYEIGLAVLSGSGEKLDKLVRHCFITSADGKSYAINPEGKLANNISSATADKAADLVYNGQRQAPALTVASDGKTLEENVDFTINYRGRGNTSYDLTGEKPINAGTYQAVLYGMGNYGGTKTVEFEISQVSLPVKTIRLSKSTYTYTGKAIKPVVNVELDGKKLVAGTDFCVSYANNYNAGTGKVIVTGNGNYGGKTEISFTIKKASQKITAKSYTKTYGNKAFKLNAKAQGKLTYKSSNTKAAKVDKAGKVSLKGPGQATITITAAATQNYNAVTKRVTITVKPKKTASLKVKSSKRKMTVRWKGDTKVTGYQITYAKNKKFSKGKKNITISKNRTTYKTIQKLKSKQTYYVKVRAYKKVGKIKIYGSYSSAKKVKVK